MLWWIHIIPKTSFKILVYSLFFYIAWWYTVFEVAVFYLKFSFPLRNSPVKSKVGFDKYKSRILSLFRLLCALCASFYKFVLLINVSCPKNLEPKINQSHESFNIKSGRNKLLFLKCHKYSHKKNEYDTEK
jgi:hypothetical protein